MHEYTTEERIYSLSTPFQASALALFRASGELSLDAIKPFFTGNLDKTKTNATSHGYIIDKNGNKVDEVVLIKYEKGHGYTSEEAFEIISHGSVAVMKKLMLTLEEAGFRQALPGEFTYRAFMHGRLDLTEAEAVEELVKAQSENTREDALARLSGSLKNEVNKVKDDLLNILASLEVYLDYGEDEIIEPWAFPEERLDKIIERLNLIISTFSSSRLYSQGAMVVLSGKTNAGKSSLFNALLKEDRAIVSSVEGTTRDYIEAQTLINGIPIRLFDTAGLRESFDEVEIEGIKRSTDLLKEADLIIRVLDLDEKVEEKEDKTIYIYSKSDLKERDSILSFSSKTGAGLDNIINEISSYLTSSKKRVKGVPQIDSERQKKMLEKTVESLERVKKVKNESEDIIALYLQSALSYLSELTGEVTTDDLLEELFSSFCLGK